MIVILSVTILLLLIYKYLWPKNKYWENRGLVAYRIKMYFSMKNVVHQIGKTYTKMKVDGQRVAGLYLTWEKLLLLTDHQLLQDVYNKCLIKKTLLKTQEENHQLVFDVLLQTATEFVVELQEFARSDKEINFRDLSTKYMSDIMTSLTFGIDFNKLTNSRDKIRDLTLQAGAFSLKSLVKCLLIEWYPSFAKRLKLSPVDSTARNFFVKLVEEAVELRKHSKKVRVDLLQDLLDEENPDGEKKVIHIEEIAEKIMSFFVAGVEPPAVTIGYSLIEIKRNLHVESKVRSEICRIVQKYNFTLNAIAFEEMIYLNALITETLRMYPPLPMLRLKTSETFNILDKIEIEQNTTLVFSLLAMQRDENNYKEPNLFNPERFTSEYQSQSEKIVENHFLDYDDSAQFFDKKTFILLCKISLALILWNFDYEISEKMEYPIRIDAPNGVLVPLDKIIIKFSPLVTSL